MVSQSVCAHRPPCLSWSRSICGIFTCHLKSMVLTVRSHEKRERFDSKNERNEQTKPSLYCLYNTYASLFSLFSMATRCPSCSSCHEHPTLRRTNMWNSSLWLSSVSSTVGHVALGLALRRSNERLHHSMWEGVSLAWLRLCWYHGNCASYVRKLKDVGVGGCHG